MPVDFHDLPPEELCEDEPPSRLIWGLLLVLAMAAGAALTLFFWPKERPAHGWQFFAWMFGVAPLIWACGFATRLHGYELRVWRVQGHNAERARIIAHNTAYARRPLALFGSAYVTAMGQEKLAEKIIAGETALETREVRNTKEVRTHSELQRTDFASTADLLESIFSDVLTRLKPVLRSAPPNLPLEVWFDIQDEVAAQESKRIWDRFRHMVGRPVEAPIRMPLNDGVMALDLWLDDNSAASEKSVLVIAVQLRSEVPANSGEAATALLFGLPELEREQRQPAFTAVHRPVVTPSDHERTVLATALDWSETQPSDIDRTWISGLTELKRNNNLVSVPQATAETAPRIADIDAALGDTGNASGWLAIAVAAEQARSRAGVQLVSTTARQQPCWLAVRSSPSPSLNS